MLLGALLLSIIVVIIIVIESNEKNSSYKEITQQSTTQQTNEVIVRVKNYLSPIDLVRLTNEINYNDASYFMSNHYADDELKDLMKVFMLLEYDLDKNRNNMYSFIGAVVHFQKENGLEVDGMAGPNTLKALSRALAENKEADNVKYYIKTDSAVVKEYGWNSRKVDDFIYFVSYEFDYDNNYNNGFFLYAFEVNLRNRNVVIIEGTLLDKYRRLGFID